MNYCPTTGKIQHDSRSKAESHRHYIIFHKDKKSKMSVYLCQSCGKWHIGRHHVTKRFRRRTR